MKKIIKLSTIASAILLPNLVQAQATSPMEVSATVIPGCFIEADNINFGNLITPITNQSATSNMRIHCSKGSSLDIKINYSNSNGSNNSGGNYTFTLTYNNVSDGWTAGKIYRDGQPISNYSLDYQCHQGDTHVNQVYFHNEHSAKLYGGIVGWNDDYNNVVCGTDKRLNATTLSSLGTPLKGVLSGLVKGEQIKYSLEKPDSASIIWNSSNAYKITANGQSQTIPMKANIVSADNPTHRMSPDSYQDTLTVVLTY